jgi:glycosyltransferase involved in cell wall biosynthesis
MKRKKIGLYDPYLDVLGGGEKHILSIVNSISRSSDIDIFWDKDIYKEIKSRLNIVFTSPPKFKKNIFSSNRNLIQKLNALREYDAFFYVTDGSYFFSTAKKNYIFCMIPNQKLYNMSFINKAKTSNYKFISNSQFTKNWLFNWGVQSQVIYPYIDKDFVDFNINGLKKEKVILSVGRFFKHLHSKRQDLLIKAFLKLKKENLIFKDYKLILAGGLKNQDKKYFLSLKNKYRHDSSIKFKENISFKDLLNLYKRSIFFWHIAGFGIDENKNPHLAEHFGLAPLEAMAMGCITFGYNAGGLKETIIDGKNGFLFNSIGQLVSKSSNALNNPKIIKKIQDRAKKFVQNKFSKDIFDQKVRQVIKI